MTKDVSGLNDLEQKIISLLDLDSRQDLKEIAKKIKQKPKKVKLIIDKLISSNVIKGFYPLLDVAMLGKQFLKIFIKLKVLKTKRIKEILQYFSEQNGMAQVLQLEGAWDIQLFFLAEDTSDLMGLMHAINVFCGKEIRKKEILVVDSFYRFSLNLSPKIKKELFYCLGSNRKDYFIDDLSLDVLREVTYNARASFNIIAKKLSAPTKTVENIYSKLVKDGIILANHISINYNALRVIHYQIAFQVNDPRAIIDIINFFRLKKKTIFAARTLGYYDCSVEIFVKNPDELKSLMNELVNKFSDKINVYDVMLIYNEFKLRLFPI